MQNTNDENVIILDKSDALSADVRKYFKERPDLVNAQADADALWVTINGRGRLTPRVESLFRKATKSKRSLLRGLVPTDFIVLTGERGRRLAVNGEAVRRVAGAKHTGRLSAAQKKAAFDHFAAQVDA